jgi:hypothetical protein
MKPLASIPVSALRGLKAVLTDIDDTLTLHGRLPAKPMPRWKTCARRPQGHAHHRQARRMV